MLQTKAKSKILLPRGYLSWSAYSTFKRSKQEYIRHYFYGEPGFKSKEMDFGTEFAEHLESGADHEDAVIDMALKSIERLPMPEFNVEAKMASPWGVIPLIGKLDQYDPKPHDFDEFKTGRRKWTATMAQNHGQMKFYQLILWLNHGVIDNRKRLVWIETEVIDGKVVPTGRIETYPVTITLADLLVFGKEVTKVAKEISDLYQEEMKNI